jgi:hypothetical protein
MLFLADPSPRNYSSTSREPHKHDNQEGFSLEDVVAIHGRSASLVNMEVGFEQSRGILISMGPS